MELGKYGIWTSAFWKSDHEVIRRGAAVIEDLGFGTVWVPSSRDIFDRCRAMLESTSHLVAATGIASIWHHDPDEIAAAYNALERDYPGRFLLGLGVSHAISVNTETPGRFEKPITRMKAYLDALDAADPPVPASRRVLAALRPQMLALARDRAAGAHPYLVTPQHTAEARGILGAGRILAVEQPAVLERDPDRARRLARAHLAYYALRENYVNSWKHLGFTDEDAKSGPSDRLVDALVAWGDDTAIRDRLDAHFAAGATHVCVQVVEQDEAALPVEGWTRLAGILK